MPRTPNLVIRILTRLNSGGQGEKNSRLSRMNFPVAAVFLVLLVLLLLVGRRTLDRRADDQAWTVLVQGQEAGAAQAVFDGTMIEDLPDPAQRYFLYTIRVGAPLYRAVEIEMKGELGFGSKDEPKYRPMHAHQILAPPRGLVWKLETGPVSGSDGATPRTSWTRFWLFGLLPIVRAGGDEDHHRSAFGRVVAEGAIWAPASLLPGDVVRWEPVDDSTARAVVSYRGFEQSVDITVADNGRPSRIVIQRWSNENPDKVFREQPFGGDLSAFREFDGYRLPTRVEGGNHIGTDDYFPFFKAEVISIRFPATSVRE